MCENEKWKKSNNEYHYYLEMGGRHIYSQKVVDWIAQKISSSEIYLAEAREKYKAKINKIS